MNQEEAKAATHGLVNKVKDELVKVVQSSAVNSRASEVDYRIWTSSATTALGYVFAKSFGPLSSVVKKEAFEEMLDENLATVREIALRSRDEFAGIKDSLGLGMTCGNPGCENCAKEVN